MSNVAGAQAQAKKFADQNFVSSDAEEIRDAIKDLGSSVGDMATRQYERAQGTVTDSLQEAGNAVRRNPLTAIADPRFQRANKLIMARVPSKAREKMAG